jgi:hypothetical protein
LARNPAADFASHTFMRLSTTKDALLRTIGDVQHNHTMAMAAGLSYCFVMALFPTLVVTNQGKLALKKPPPRKVYPKEPPKDADGIAA